MSPTPIWHSRMWILARRRRNAMTDGTATSAVWLRRPPGGQTCPKTPEIAGQEKGCGQDREHQDGRGQEHAADCGVPQRRPDVTLTVCADTCPPPWRHRGPGLRWHPKFVAPRGPRRGRRGGRVAEGARLESVYTGNRIEGSNPSVSASYR